MARRGVYPGSFDPLTVAHVAIADVAQRVCALDGLDLTISRDPIGKPRHGHLPPAARLADIARIRAADRPWLGSRITDARLLAEIAAGYDVLVMGADKWLQLHDVAYYDGEAHRDALLAELPTVAVSPRAGVDIAPGPDVILLPVPEEVLVVSSSAVRNGRVDWRA